MRKTLCAAALAIAIGMLPSAAGAQRTALWRDSAQRLSLALHALNDSLVHGDSTATEVARNGNLVMSASPGEGATALDAFAYFMRERTEWFGTAMPSPDGFRLVLRTEDGGGIFGRGGRRVGVIVLAGLPDTGRSARSQRGTTSADASTRLVDQYGELMFAAASFQVTGWLQNPPEWTRAESDRRNVAMYRLVTGMGPVERGCIAGQLAACAVGLDIIHAASGEVGPIFDTSMRADILMEALKFGGPGAWTRLIETAPNGIAPALAAASGMPVDSLVARWRRDLLARRPTDKPLDAATAVAALAWTAILFGSALGIARWA